MAGSGLVPAIPTSGGGLSGSGLVPATPKTGHRRVYNMPSLRIGETTYGGQDIGKESAIDQLGIDALEGFYRSVASVLDAPGNLVSYVWENTVGDGKQNPEEVMASAASMFKRYGITDPEAKLNPIAENFGMDTITALAGFGAASKLSKLTPRAVDAGKGLIERFSNRVVNTGRSVGREMMANPGATAASEAAASVGGSGLEELAEGTGYESAASTVGNLIGGGAVGVAAGGARMTRNAMPKKALLGETRDPSMVTQFATENLAAERDAIDLEIEDMIMAVTKVNPKMDRLTQARTSARVATRVTRQAEGRSRGTESALWDAAAVGRPHTNTALKNQWAQIRQRYGEPGMPASGLDGELARLGRRIEQLPDEGLLSDVVGAGSIRSDALAFMRRAASRIDGGGIAYRDMDELQTFIVNDVRAAYPGDEPLRQAHEWSRWHNDRFWRDDSRLHPFVTGTFAEQEHQKLVNNLINHESGGEGVRVVSERLQFTRLVAAYQRNIRDQFVAITTNWGKTGRSAAEIQANRKEAADWISKPETRTFMQDLPTEMADTHLAANRLVERMDARDLVAGGAFNRLAQADIGQAADQVLQAGDKAAAVKTIMDGISDARRLGIGGNSGDYEEYPTTLARNGFQAEVINRLFAQAQYDPTKLHQMVTSRRDLREMLSALLPGKAKDDFYSIVSDAMGSQRGSIAEGDISLSKSIIKAPATLASAILGARVGAGLGTGTIQAPATTAGFLRGIAEKYFSVLDPTKTLGRAVIDPHFRKLLHASLPRNRREHGYLFRAVTLALASANASVDALEQDTGVRYLDPSIRPKGRGRP